MCWFQIKCPKNSSSDDDSFGIDLTGGFSYTGWSVCGLQIYTGERRTIDLFLNTLQCKNIVEIESTTISFDVETLLY